MDTDKKPVKNATLLFVLGMHRSGTSAVTQFIHRLGAAIGPDLLAPMAGVNEGGFWEDSAIVAINERLLAEAGLRWYDCDPIPAGHGAAAQAIRAEATAHLAAAYAGHPLAVVKDPRLCRLLPFWLDRCRECGITPAFVYVLRHPFAVAKSLHRRDGLPYEYSMLLWLIHTLESIRAGAGQPTLLVDFERVLADPGALATPLRERHGAALAAGPAELERAARAALRAASKTQDHRLDARLGCGDIVGFAQAVHDALRRFDGGAIDIDAMENLFERQRVLWQRCAADIAMLQRLATESLALRAEVARIGELHSYALHIIAERDREIARRESADVLNGAPWRRLVPRLIPRK